MNAIAALNRARRAWERSQPQLFMEFDGLDEGRHPWRRDLPSLVEPAATAAHVSPDGRSPGGGLTAGAEPCRDLLGTDGESALFTAPAAGWSAGSAPLFNQTAPGRTGPEDVRGQGQEVTL